MLWYLTSFASAAYTISIVGAQGRLGRELVSQSLQRGWEVEGIVRRPLDPIRKPVRKGWLHQEESDEESPHITSPRLRVSSDTLRCTSSDAIVFCMSATPFASRAEMRVQTQVVEDVLDACSKGPRVCLVSAYGAGDSLQGSNVGIQFMHSVYLREAYAAKEEQERLVRERVGKNSSLILRPRVLSFTRVPLNPGAVPRHELATRILDWCAECVPQKKVTNSPTDTSNSGHPGENGVS